MSPTMSYLLPSLFPLLSHESFFSKFSHLFPRFILYFISSLFLFLTASYLYASALYSLDDIYHEESSVQ